MIVVAVPLQPRQRLVGQGPFLDLRQLVVDRGMAAGRNPHAMALADEMEDQVGARVGLARAGRTLDEQVAVLQTLSDPPGLVQVERSRLQRPAAWVRGRARDLRAQDLTKRTVASGCVESARGDVARKAL